MHIPQAVGTVKSNIPLLARYKLMTKPHQMHRR